MLEVFEGLIWLVGLCPVIMGYSTAVEYVQDLVG
jgi:hypothetical protein